MKSGISAVCALISSLLLATMLLNGCAVFGRGEPARMVATLQSVQDDYQETALGTKAVAESLNELVVTEVVDLAQAYRVFSERVDRIQATGRRLMVHADEMHFNGPSYLVESGVPPTACPYPRLREPGDVQAAQLGAYFDPIADESWEVKRAFRAYQFDVTRVRDALSANLTPRTVEAMSPIIRKAKLDGDSLREALRRALAAIEKAKTVMPQAAPPS